MHLNAEIIRNNELFISHNRIISEINEKLAMAKYYPTSSIPQQTIDSLNRELDKNEQALKEVVATTGYLKYTKEGISNEKVV